MPTTRWRAAIWLDPISNAKQKDCRAEGEGNVARPVDLLMFANGRDLAQHQVGPDGPGDAEGDTDEKDEAPAKVRQDAAQDQADDRAEDHGDRVNTQSETAAIRLQC